MSKKTSTVMVIARQIADSMIREQTAIRMQMSKDVAFKAAHRVFGMGPGRAPEFDAVYEEELDNMANLFIEDGKDDGQMWYAKAKNDEELKAIVGEENFKPHDQRYGSMLFCRDRVRAKEEKT